MGEWLMYALVALIFIALIFGIITLINWAVSKNDGKFYGWLLLAIAVPIFILFAIS